MSMYIYNLEFPPYIKQLNIGGYIFERVDDYEEKFKGLQHFVNQIGSEFSILPTTGNHQQTANIITPIETKKANLPRGHKEASELDDILLLLSIFTGREVFAVDQEVDGAIIRDSRLHHFGGSLHCSIEYKTGYLNLSKNIYIDEKIANRMNTVSCNIGFEEEMNRLLETIRSDDWKGKYNGGYYLFLYRQAILRHYIEVNFIMCWTLREHLFSVHNGKRLQDDKIVKMSGEEKISYIFSEYFCDKISRNAHKEIQKITKARNRIIHYGIKPEDIDYKEMDFFIRATECLVAKTLGLKPSNIFNVSEKLKDFLHLDE